MNGLLSHWCYDGVDEEINKMSYRSCGVRGCDNFSWLRQPKYGFRNDARIESLPLTNDWPDRMLAFGPPRVNELRVEALGDV